MEIIFASNNKHKIEDVKSILSNYTIKSLSDLNIDHDTVEDESTLMRNALKKAREVYALTGKPTIGDDSGIFINALNGYPGVLTKRFLTGSEEERTTWFTCSVEGKSRRASIQTALAYVDGNKEHVSMWSIDGYISDEALGENGYDYDKIFIPEGCEYTLAQMDKETQMDYNPRRYALYILESNITQNVNYEITDEELDEIFGDITARL